VSKACLVLALALVLPGCACDQKVRDWVGDVSEAFALYHANVDPKPSLSPDEKAKTQELGIRISEALFQIHRASGS